MINKDLAKSYSEVIKICRLLKTHATDILLLENGLVAMTSALEFPRAYLRTSTSYREFLYTQFDIGKISSVNSKYKKTKSEIDWRTADGQRYLVIQNPDMPPSKNLVLNSIEQRNSVLDATYGNLPGWDIRGVGMLAEEPDSAYIALPEQMLQELQEKKLCELLVDGVHKILVAKPFFGNTKKTEWLGYRVVEKSKATDAHQYDRILIKYKQKEEIGNIYTYAAYFTYF